MEALSDLYNVICCQIIPQYPEPYSFQFGSQHTRENAIRFQSNSIKTTKYSLLNFFPKAIINQYRRIANLYFLAVAIMSTIPGVTPLSPALIWLPLGIVMVVSLIKEGYQDYHRGLVDTKINQINKTRVVRGQQLVNLPWSQIIVGDICQIKEQEAFPADLLLLSTCKNDGVAYIQTATLDGEKTSKIRYAFQAITTKIKNLQDVRMLTGVFNGEVPSQSLEDFRATICIAQQRFNINDSKQLLYRGAKLKNTQQIWGLVIYTGPCSKIMMNSQIASSKTTQVEKRLNILLIGLFLCQIILCLTMTIYSLKYEKMLYSNFHYLSWNKQSPTAKNFVKNFMMFFIDYSSIIPISLIVSMEIVKLAQSYFIDFDKLMFCKQKNQGSVARSTALNEQLGQISYFFTDKTGTLTTNLMTFHSAVIADQIYTFEVDSDQNYSCPTFSSDIKDEEEYPLTHHLKLDSDDRLITMSIKNQQQLKHNYLLALLCCNTVNTVTKQDKVVYESESPDEIALAKLAKSMGYELLKREFASMQVQIKGKTSSIRVLQKFGFSSQRKRMSVLVEVDGKKILFVKGADNIVSERIKPHSFKIAQAVQLLSQKGLRTLMVAMKVVSNQQYFQFSKAINQSALSQRQQVMDRFASRFQQNLDLIGATALLDQLQTGVPQTLHDLQRAHIKVWMLTGDKLQTAIQVSKSCSLIESNYIVIECKTSNRISITEQMNNWQVSFSKNFNRKHSLVIQGSRLNEVLVQQKNSKRFAQLSQNFTTVICCRLLPIQKAHVVKVVRKYLNKICMAIGDGGNDVSMLKQAHIGVGLFGEEGMSAVQASDYALPQFKMVWRLLFIHGRWNYLRVTQMILYFTYKSLLFTIPRVVFATFNGFSGQPIFDDYYIALYNVLFTSVPLLIRALFEQDINYVIKKGQEQSNPQNQVDRTREKKSQKRQIWSEDQFLPKGFKIDWQIRRLLPKIYFVGKENEVLNIKNCLLWIAEATILGVLTSLLCIGFMSKSTIDSHGYSSDLWMTSITIYSVIIILNNVKIAMHIRHWTVLFLFSVIGCSLVPYLCYIWISNYTLSKYVQGTVRMSFVTPTTYLVVILVTILCIAIVSLIIYISFHGNKVMKKLRFKMIALAQCSTVISQSHREEYVNNEGLVAEQNNQKLEARVLQLRQTNIKL